MEDLVFDSGIRQFRAGGGVLRFNPADPNLYARFLDAMDRIRALEAELSAGSGDALAMLCRADAAVKAILQEVFGPDSDIAAVFSGVNLMAMGTNGKPILNNFLEAVEPILTEGIRACAAREAGA